ncbi:NRT1/ PTR FAMILY 8.1 [Spatholobus suberectus]|nr:NRT1/ PTR FAMILY 8.1 [Spatholobus suberectus]
MLGRTCLDKAAIETESDHAKDSPNPWTLCRVTQVEELQSIIRFVPVWPSLIAFATVSQMDTMFTLQGNTMDQHMALTPKSPQHPSPSLTLSVPSSGPQCMTAYHCPLCKKVHWP